MLKCVKFAELPVTDQDRALRFYTEKVGLRVAEAVAYTDEWRWIELEIPGADTRILFTRRQDGIKEDAPRLVLVADSVDATYQELTRKGVHFTKPPTRAPWNPDETYAQFRDSEGNGVVIGSS